MEVGVLIIILDLTVDDGKVDLVGKVEDYRTFHKVNNKRNKKHEMLVLKYLQCLYRFNKSPFVN